ncbi:FitA-like ribbon-helix-helix domain-containing protein [Bifidobacterium avesanii]|uniref:Arc family DNA-binding protein n=1 Tax=Bifidobacterium avesanii TaxID=1798157 RepID=A0A7K3TGB2_9BIFI|nr:Arc family DNA-binding protein [Bifidobacterium avesanii]KAB8294629.1 plasmid stability protein [Bifidobacterium avesanii]NEG78137.1 Arc family DNA-binding protein [Bifidobacterium avesanii]
MTTSLLIRRLPDEVKERLAEAARANGRSTEAQARSVLEEFTASWVANRACDADFFAQIRRDLLDGDAEDENAESLRPRPRTGDRPRTVELS